MCQRKIILMLVKMVRKILFKTIAIRVKRWNSASNVAKRTGDL